MHIRFSYLLDTKSPGADVYAIIQIHDEKFSYKIRMSKKW